MALKIGRNYIAEVQTQLLEYRFIQYPITCNFDITRNQTSSMNSCHFEFLNLSKKNRDDLYCDFYQGSSRMIHFRAGYGNNLMTCFTGTITEAHSRREGVDFITEITCFDGGYSYGNNQSSFTLPSGSTQSIVLTRLLADLKNPDGSLVPLGAAIGKSYLVDMNGQVITLKRDTPFDGPTVELLKQFTNNGFFIDQGKAYIMADSDYALNSNLQVINASSGLLNTPVREQTILHFDMLFEPGLTIGQRITLISETNPMVNRNYKVISVKHHGTISDAVCGEAITTVGLEYGAGKATVSGT